MFHASSRMQFPTLVRMVCGVFALLGTPAVMHAEETECDLLIVGGTEGGVAAAVQAARLGVKRIVLVNDIGWLGGQFTAEGLGAIDEWTIYQVKRTWFPRSGLFREMMDLIEADNVRKYGLSRPGNCFCAWTTCEPRDTEKLFRQLVAPYLVEQGGPLRIIENYEPAAAIVEGARVVGVRFDPREEPAIGPPLVVRAALTIDASDWGDVVRLSGAKYLCGPDLRSRFHESGAPVDAQQVRPNEMNPITYCLVLRESEKPTVIEKPAHYDERRYYGTTTATRAEYDRLKWPAEALKPFAPAWKETALADGPYTGGPTVYHHRRLVDRRHNDLSSGTECTLINWPLQDYPTCDFPQDVIDQLEATEPGAAQKNLAAMTPRQRRIVFADAKLHALGMLYHLQTTVADKQPAGEVTFRDLQLTDEFGTPDRLPWKPYVREGLRTEALYMVREQDVRDTDGVQSWAGHMMHDSVFGFQFNIDFHPTRRIFLNEDPTAPWNLVHTKLRNWSTHTDRAGFPLRSLVPVETDGLLVAGKNLGMSSLVQSAVRLHGHGMHSGQAAATIAALCLEQHRSPRTVARETKFVRQVQGRLLNPPLVAGRKAPGVLLWPYQDLPPEAEHFVAANQLAIRSILPGEPGQADFQAAKTVSRRELARAVARAALSVGKFPALNAPALVDKSRTEHFKDVPREDPDFAVIESLVYWKVIADEKKFDPQGIANVETMRQMFARLNWSHAIPIQEASETKLTRAPLALWLWKAIADQPERTFAGLQDDAAGNNDSDGDGIPDREDPLPLDRDNDSLPDLFDPDGQ
jgi:hypothetical protein